MGDTRAAGTCPLSAELRLSAREPLFFELPEIARPPLLLLAPEGLQVGPGVKTSVVPVVENDAHRVIADGPEIVDLHVPFLRDSHTLIRAVPLNFSRRAHHPQHLGCQL